MSLKIREPFANLVPANGFIYIYILSNGVYIIMRDLNHLMLNVCKWFMSYDCYVRRKPFARHMKVGL